MRWMRKVLGDDVSDVDERRLLQRLRGAPDDVRIAAALLERWGSSAPERLVDIAGSPSGLMMFFQKAGVPRDALVDHVSRYREAPGRLVTALVGLRSPAAADAVAALASVGDHRSNPCKYVAQKSLDETVLSGDGAVLDAVLRRRPRLGERAQVVMLQHIQARLYASDRGLRLLAITAVASYAPVEAQVAALVPLFDDIEPEVAAAAVGAFPASSVPPEDATQFLVRMLTHPDERVAAAAARALPSDHPDAARALITALADTRLGVADTAVAALSRASVAGDAAPWVLPALDRVARRDGDRLAGTLATGAAGRRVLGDLRGARSIEVPLLCAAGDGEVVRYAVYPPWAERPMGGTAPVEAWGWGPFGAPPAATTYVVNEGGTSVTKDATDELSVGRIPAAFRAVTRAMLDNPAWAALRDAVCSECGRAWCQAHQDVSRYEDIEGLSQYEVDQWGGHERVTVRYPCHHERVYWPGSYLGR